MKAEVEQRIVEMRFENEQFEKAAKQSLSTLEKLDGVLDLLGSQGGLERLSGVLDTVQRRFSTLGIAGAAAIEKITGKVLNLASNLLTAIPRQILSGGTTRATNLEQAKFQLKGLGIAWGEVSDDMEYAVNGAAYGLDEAAKAASLLGDKLDHNVTYKIGEAGQEASELGHALRAISGVAAMTNSSYGDITDIFADAAALGRVTNDTLMRLSYRGMNATAALAKGLNKTEQEIQQMVRKGEISLKTFADVMDATYGQHAVDANETYAGSLMNMKAALSRIGADFITPWHEGLRKIQNGLRNMFNRVRTITRPFAEGVFTNWVEYFAAKIEKLSDRAQFSGLKAIVNLLSNVDLTWIGRGMDKLAEFITSIRELFTVKQKVENGQWAEEFINEKALARVEKVKKFWNGLKELGRLAQETFELIWEKISDLTGGGLTNLIDKVLDLGAAFGEITSNRKWLNDTWVGIKKWVDLLARIAGSLKNTVGKALEVVFIVIRDVINAISGGRPIQKVGDLLYWIGEKIISVSDKLGEWLGKLKSFLEEHGTIKAIIEGIGGAFQSVGDFIGSAKERLAAFFDYLRGLKDNSKLIQFFANAKETISDWISNVGAAFRETFGGENSIGGIVAKVIGLIVAGFAAFRKGQGAKWFFERIDRTFDFLTGQWDIAKTIANLPDKISTMFTRINGTLRAFTDNLNTQSIKTIAEAVLMLAIAIGILSLVNAKKAGVALGVVTASLGELLGVFKILSKSKKKSKTDMVAVSALFIALGAAILLIAVAVGILALIPKKKLLTAVTLLGSIFIALAGLLFVLSKLKMSKAASKRVALMGLVMVAIAASVLIIAVALTLMSLLIRKDKALTTIGLMASIFIALGAMVLFLSKIKISKKAAARVALMGFVMVAIAAAFAIIAVAMIAMSLLIRKDKALTTIGLMASIFVALGGMIFFLSKLKVSRKAMTKVLLLSVVMILIAVAVAIISVAMIAMSLLICKDKALTTIGLMASIFIALGAMIFFLSKLKVSPKAMTKILLLSAIMVVIGIAVAVIAVTMIAMSLLIRKDKALVTIGLMASIFIALGAMVFFLSKLKVTPISMKKILLLSAVMVVIAAAVAIIAGAMTLFGFLVGRGNALAVIGLMVAIFVALGAMVFFLSKLKVTPTAQKKILMLSVVMVIIAAAVAIIAVAIGLMSMFVQPEKMVATVAGVLVVLFALVAIVFLLGKIDFKTSGVAKVFMLAVVIVVLAAALVVIAVAFRVLADIDSTNMLAAGLALGLVLVAIIGALAILSSFSGTAALASAASMLIIAAAIVVLAYAFKMMSDVDIDKMLPVALLLLGTIAVMAVALATLGLVGPVVIVAAAAMLLLSGAIYILALAFERTVPALDQLADVLPKFAAGVESFNRVQGTDLAKMFGALAAGVGALIGLNLVMGWAAPKKLGELGEALIPLSHGIQAFREVSGWDLLKMFGGLAGAVGTLLGLNFTNVHDFKTLGDGLYSLGGAITAFPQNAGTMLSDFANQLKAGEPVLGSAVTSIISVVIVAIDKGNNDIRAAVIRIVIYSSKVFNDNKDVWKIHGGNIAVGIANGINGKAYLAYNAMNQLANGLSRSFTFSLDIHSPSGVFEHLTGFIPMAVAIALQNGEPQVTRATEQMMAGAMGVMDQYAKNASDISPSVTPVMDMATMRKNMVYADQMWNRSALSSMAGISGLRINGDTINYNMQNKDVVDAITSMNHKIGELGKAIENMQLVMDTGLVVGGLAPAMNNKLGEMAVRERRQ